MADPCFCGRCIECLPEVVTAADVADLNRHLDEAHVAILQLAAQRDRSQADARVLLARQAELTAEVARLKLQVAELETAGRRAS